MAGNIGVGLHPRTKTPAPGKIILLWIYSVGSVNIFPAKPF
jgi:hypothetical protein